MNYKICIVAFASKVYPHEIKQMDGFAPDKETVISLVNELIKARVASGAVEIEAHIRLDVARWHKQSTPGVCSCGQVWIDKARTDAPTLYEGRCSTMFCQDCAALPCVCGGQK